MRFTLEVSVKAKKLKVLILDEKPINLLIVIPWQEFIPLIDWTTWVAFHVIFITCWQRMGKAYLRPEIWLSVFYDSFCTSFDYFIILLGINFLWFILLPLEFEVKGMIALCELLQNTHHLYIIFIITKEILHLSFKVSPYYCNKKNQW